MLSCLQIAFSVAYVAIAWALSFVVKNAGLLDFAWPSLFTLLENWLVDGSSSPSLLLAALQATCDLRFMLAWAVRTHTHGEDRHWNFWRKYWKAGEYLCNPFGLRYYCLEISISSGT